MVCWQGNPDALLAFNNGVLQIDLKAPELKKYCDISVPVPEQWDFYLRRYYKEYMNLPPKEEQERGLAFEYQISDVDYDLIKEVIE